MDTYCIIAKRIIGKEGEIVVKKNGDVTNLYWHILECDECANLREEE